MEHLGRLNTPLFKRAGRRPLSRRSTWDFAIAHAAEQLQGDRSATAASSIPPAARRTRPASCSSCWRAPGAPTTSTTARTTATRRPARASTTTIGKGTSTVELEDLTGADLIFVIGANPSSNHPRFIHMLKACRDRGGDVIVINPAKEPGLVKFAVPKSAGLDAHGRHRDRVGLPAAADRHRHRAVQGADEGGAASWAPRIARSSPRTPAASTPSAPISTR